MKKVKFNRATKQQHKKSGFTIIEVVLVLAIAGLIFLMVFIALPALQRNQRNTQRKNDASRLKDAIERYKGNNRGSLPFGDKPSIERSDLNPFLVSYLNSDNGEFKDPSGYFYYLYFNSPSIASSTRWRWEGSFDTNIDIDRGKKCDGEYIIPEKGRNSYTIYVKLEGGKYCIDG